MAEFKNLKAIFDHFSTVTIDGRFKEQVMKWKLGFYSRNPDHVGFFTGNYFGVHIPKWTGNDDDYWLIDVLDIDEDEIADYAYQLPTINKEHNVSSNILSIGLLYLMHRTQTDSSRLSEKDRDELKVNLMEIMCSRYLSSIINHYFSRGPTTPEIAQETYNRLSMRFDLKEAGSWMAFIKKRSEGLVLGEHQRKSAKFEKQEVFDTFADELVVRKLNAVKTSLNRTVVEINAEFRKVLEDKDKILSQSAQSNGEDGLYVKDLLRNESLYLTYQDSLFLDKQSFLRTDLMEIIEGSMETISTNIFRGALEWILDNAKSGRYQKDIATMRKDIMLYTLDLIREEEIKTTDLVQIAYRLRQNFMSGKSNDPVLVKCRKTVDKLIIVYRPKSRGKTITLERVAILMYVSLRTLMMGALK